MQSHHNFKKNVNKVFWSTIAIKPQKRKLARNKSCLLLCVSSQPLPPQGSYSVSELGYAVVVYLS